MNTQAIGMMVVLAPRRHRSKPVTFSSWSPFDLHLAAWTYSVVSVIGEAVVAMESRVRGRCTQQSCHTPA